MRRNLDVIHCVVYVLDCVVNANNFLPSTSRCIVIQKQTGGKADSGEASDDEDYDYKRPQPKAPSPDRLRHDTLSGSRKNEVEVV